ncbi:hypothetical protein [Legionella oakridgensis]|uniref:hypothetical protein n=1 Tax=Legionella oakridgensis TaxID=29423 RepID=UPI00046CFFBB|nr:hypothetical protein [Legionella oakridgensis]
MLGWLEPVATNIAGVIFTFDYNFLQRIILKVCRRLHIQTILIPHESVFFNRDKYYYHAISGVNSPLCDYVLCWGQLQKDIFVSRDYPGERISVVGAPKFDHYYNFQPKFTREQFCRKAKLNSHSKIVVYAAQSLDVQVNQPLALKAQQKIIDELISYCCKRQYGFILRYPPTQLPIVNERIITRMKRERFFIDNSIKGYCFEPEETIYHADVIISINSTMLFEALLMGKQTLSVRYFNFEEGWEKAGVPCINTRSELIQILDEWLQATEPTLGKITTWAKEAYSSGEFDGQASIRIRNFLESKIKNPVLKLDNAIERVLKDDLPGADMVYVPSFTKSYSYLPALIRTKRILTNKDTNLLPWADMTIQLSDFDDNRRAKKQRHLYKLSKLYVSKGLIRPKNLIYQSSWMMLVIIMKQIKLPAYNNC